MTTNLLVCGSRGRYKYYKDEVFRILDEYKQRHESFIIIEGCCPGSADEYAEEWAKQNNIDIQHHPGQTNNNLKRNLEMLMEADEVIAFWDGYSYGTAFVISNALMMNEEHPPRIIKLIK